LSENVWRLGEHVLGSTLGFGSIDIQVVIIWEQGAGASLNFDQTQEEHVDTVLRDIFST
jgi:hypothetical protein